MTKHVDNLDCNCLVTVGRVDTCQYVNCDQEEGGDMNTATDGTVMHGSCWNAYDREWRRLHPNANQMMEDATTEVMERRAGA